jgi:hypothetical protein
VGWEGDPYTGCRKPRWLNLKVLRHGRVMDSSMFDLASTSLSRWSRAHSSAVIAAKY